MINHRKALLVLYLAALSAFAPFSTDIYLASMPTIQHLFNTTAANVQLTLSLFFIGFAIAQLAWGPLSDRFGRRPVVFIGLTLFVMGSLSCAVSTNITMLIISRIIQSIGACSGIVMVLTIIKDSFPNPNEMSKCLSITLSIRTLAPMIAPVIGSYLLVHINWQANFYFLTSYGILLLMGTLFLKESYPKHQRKPLPMNKLFHAYHEQIRHAPFLFAAIATGTNFAVLFAFISSSSFIYINIYHLAPHLFGYFFAINAAMSMAGASSLPKLKKRFTDQRIIFAGITLIFLGAITMLLFIYAFNANIWLFVIPMAISTYGITLLLPELTAQALKNSVAYHGITSSLAGVCRYTFGALIGFLMGFIIKDSAVPLAIVMIILNGLTLILMVLYFRCLPTQNSLAKSKAQNQ